MTAPVSTAPEVEAPVFSGFSLGAKFVGLTAGLILLLSATAFISLRNSAETVGQIETVVEFAIPDVWRPPQPFTVLPRDGPARTMLDRVEIISDASRERRLERGLALEEG